MKLLTALLAYMLCCNAAAHDTLEARLEQLREDSHTVGMSVALIERGKPTHVINLGLADAARKLPVTDQTRFRTASMGKMFTTLAVMRLVEDGKLALSTPLHQLAPEVEFSNPYEATAPVRIAHLMEHTTGWDDIHFVEYAYDNSREVPLAETLAFHPHSRTSRWVPGTRTAYSNAGAAVAGYVAQKVSGMLFEDWVRQSVFTPLGMASASYFEDTQLGAIGHTKDGKARPFIHILFRPCGSGISTSSDMARLVRMFLENGDGIFKPETIARMESSPGMGLQLDGYKGYALFGHGGDIGGFHALVQYSHELGVGMVVMTNSDSNVRFKVRDLVFDQWIKTPKPPYLQSPVDAHTWEDVDGLYVPDNPRIALVRFLLPFQAVRLQDRDGFVERTAFTGTWSDKLLKSGIYLIDPSTGLANGLRAQDPLAGDVVVLGTNHYRRISVLQVGAMYAVLLGLVACTLGGLVFALVWVPRRVWGQLQGGPAFRLRVWPLLASLVFIATGITPPMLKVEESALGSMTPASLSWCIGSLLYGLLVLWSAWAVWRQRGVPGNWVAYWYSVLFTVLHLCAAAYLAWFGIIPLRTWA
ncbi:serine hydrolase domain-containing protein [Undibacterium sp. TJN19]|uniref:serine hydrolase domain-containing protein n=1 Tax=Undibacterium sp. TJN19 TaxID=3413055 RepID=UPI003BF06C5D